MCFWEYFTWDSCMRIWGMGLCINWFTPCTNTSWISNKNVGCQWTDQWRLAECHLRRARRREAGKYCNYRDPERCESSLVSSEARWHDVTCLGADSAASAQMPQYRNIIRLSHPVTVYNSNEAKNGQIPSQSPVRLCLNKSWSTGKQLLDLYQNIFPNMKISFVLSSSRFNITSITV